MKNDIYELHGKKCKPGMGQGILKGKYKISSSKDASMDYMERFLKENKKKSENNNE